MYNRTIDLRDEGTKGIVKVGSFTNGMRNVQVTVKRYDPSNKYSETIGAESIGDAGIFPVTIPRDTIGQHFQVYAKTLSSAPNQGTAEVYIA